MKKIIGVLLLNIPSLVFSVLDLAGMDNNGTIPVTEAYMYGLKISGVAIILIAIVAIPFWLLGAFEDRAK